VTPPSVRFLGRRVYLGVTVLVACLRALAQPAPAPAPGPTPGPTPAPAPGPTPTRSEVPTRTVSRWLDWWQTTFVASPCFVAGAGRFVPPLDVARLPASLVERFTPTEPGALLAAVLAFVAPVTTRSARASYLGTG
jgi:hypothetical protein